MICNKYNDQVVAGFVLNELSDSQCTAFREHLSTCAECQQKIKDWQYLLEDDTDARTAPSHETRKKVFKKTIDQKVNPIQKRYKGKWAIVSMVAVFCLLVFTLSFMNIGNESAKSDMPSPSFINQSDTTLYTSATVDSNNQGHVWVNDKTRELYIFVNGINEDVSKAEVHTQKKNIVLLGDLVTADKTGHLYSRQTLPDAPEYLVVRSAERGDIKIFPLEVFQVQ